MELIIINDSHLKLTLTDEDIAVYKGDTKNILHLIMNDVKERYDIRLNEGRMLIQMFESKDGGCELFLTRLGEGKSMKNKIENLKLDPGDNKGALEYRRYTVTERGRVVIYAFDNMTCLLSCCHDLNTLLYRGSSSAYIDRSKMRYYLILDYETPTAAEHLGVLKPTRVMYYITEHCDAICQIAAVEVLGRLA